MKKHIIFAISMLFLMVGCYDRQDESSLSPDSDLSISEAELWFSKNYENTSSARLSSDKTIYKKAYWKNAYEHFYETEKGQSKIIVVPLVFQKAGVASDYKHLWVYKNKKGENTARIIEYVHENDNKEKFKSLKNFSGLMIVRNWDGDFLGGFNLKKDKIRSVISDLEYGTFSQKPQKNKKARVGANVCGLYEHCVVSYTYVVGYENEGYWHTDCITEYNCVWVNVFDSDPSAGGGFAPPAGAGNTNSDDYSFKFEVMDNECQAKGKMLQIQANEGREVEGYITSKGLVVIAPTAENTFYTSGFTTQYKDANGTTILSFQKLEEDGKFYIMSPAYSGNFKYEVVGTIHTHPAGNNQNTPSPIDLAMAQDYGNLDHYIINWSHIIKFNALGAESTEQNNCTIYVGN